MKEFGIFLLFRNNGIYVGFENQKKDNDFVKDKKKVIKK